jgi:hypothetical protein
VLPALLVVLGGRLEMESAWSALVAGHVALGGAAMTSDQVREPRTQPAREGSGAATARRVRAARAARGRVRRRHGRAALREWVREHVHDGVLYTWGVWS